MTVKRSLSRNYQRAENLYQNSGHTGGERASLLLEHALQDTGNTEMRGWALVRFKVRGALHSKSQRPKADSSLPTPDRVFSLVKTQVPGILILIGTMVRSGTTLSSSTAIKQESVELGSLEVQARQEVPTVSLLATEGRLAVCTRFTLGVSYGAMIGHGCLHGFHLNRPLQDPPKPTVVGADETENS